MPPHRAGPGPERAHPNGVGPGVRERRPGRHGASAVHGNKVQACNIAKTVATQAILPYFACTCSNDAQGALMSNHARPRWIWGGLSAAALMVAMLVGPSAPAEAYPRNAVLRTIQPLNQWDWCLEADRNGRVYMNQCKKRNDHQVWMVYRVGGKGTHLPVKLRNYATSQCLDMESVSWRMKTFTKNAKLFTTKCNDDAAQRWNDTGQGDLALWASFVGISNSKWGWEIEAGDKIGQSIKVRPHQDNDRFVWRGIPAWDYPPL